MDIGPQKRWNVRDWALHIIKSPTRCKRSINNCLIKEQAGHPLSTSEHNLLEAAKITGDR